MQPRLKQMEAEIGRIKAQLRGNPCKRVAAKLRYELESLARKYVMRKETGARSACPTAYPRGIISPRRYAGGHF